MYKSKQDNLEIQFIDQIKDDNVAAANRFLEHAQAMSSDDEDDSKFNVRSKKQGIQYKLDSNEVEEESESRRNVLSNKQGIKYKLYSNEAGINNEIVETQMYKQSHKDESINLEEIVRLRVLEATAAQDRKIQEMKKNLEENKKYTYQLKLLHEKRNNDDKNKVLEETTTKHLEQIKKKDKELLKKNKSVNYIQNTNNNTKSKSKKKINIVNDDISTKTTSNNTEGLIQLNKLVNNDNDNNNQGVFTKIWEISPVKNRETEECKGKGSSRNSRLQKVINVRKKYGEVPELLTKWTCGSLEL